MLSTDERRQRLEALLGRVQRNRANLGTGDVGAAAPPAAPPSEPMAAPTAPAELAEAEPVVEEVIIDEVDDDEPIIEVGGATEHVIDLTEEDEGPPVAEESSVIELSVDDEVTTEEVIATGEPKGEPTELQLAPPTHHLEKAAAPPALEEDDDDEPEIEISYGTEEALALEDELADGEEAPPVRHTPVPQELKRPGTDNLPARVGAQPAPAPTPAPTQFAGRPIDADTAVAEYVGEAAPAKPKTLGELLSAARNVGRRK